MLDGLYQSAICFFMAYLLFAPGTFETESGRGVADRNRMGVYVACVAIVIINSYILMNTYSWDWVMVLAAVISTLLIWAWTGIYSSFEASFQFYKAGVEVYGALSFWAETLLTVIICLLPRFAIKFFQKNFQPYDVDVIREQVRQGKFDYLDQYEAYVPPKMSDTSGASSSSPGDAGSVSQAHVSTHARYASVTESQRPFYPPSEAPTRHPHSQTGSDGTDMTRPSFDMTLTRPPNRPSSLERIPGSHEQPRNAMYRRASLERVRTSLDRPRQSFERMRPSFEGSRDFTSAALLTRLESTQSHVTNPLTPVATRRRQDITADLQ